MRTCLVAASIAVGAIISACTSVGDGNGLSFKLPHCPTPLTVTPPAVFEGQKPDQALLDEFPAVPHGEGEYVLALTTPREPSLILVIGEPSGIEHIQGKITRAQFDGIKAEFLAKNPLHAKEEANEYLKEEGYSFRDTAAFTSSSDGTSATATMLITGTAPGADFESITSYKISHVGQCIAAAMLVAPASGMSRDRINELAQSLSFR